jgi:Flp pilus assembly protein TadG
MVEFALLFPLLLLFVVGVFELGRAFFSYIAITNAAREGARVVTFWPGKATIEDVQSAIDTEIGSSPVVVVGNIISRQIQCGNATVTNDVALQTCPFGETIRVTVTYRFDTIFKFFFPGNLELKRTIEMMVP